MESKEHFDKIRRVIDILKRLYEFEYLRVDDLALDYNINPRTIRRDFKLLKDIGIPIRSSRGVYSIDSSKVSKLDRFPSALLYSFASNVGLNIGCINNSFADLPLISFAIAYGGIDKEIAKAIIESIEKGCKCRFDYTNNKGERAIRIVSPIRLYTSKGKWYLLAKDDKSQDIKFFDFLKIKNFKTLASVKHDITKEDIDKALSCKSVWSSSDVDSFSLQLIANKYASRYLQEVPLHPSQKIVDIHIDGSVEFSYEITNKMEILPEIKNWIPHIHIVSPKELREELKKDLEQYLEEIKLMDI